MSNNFLLLLRLQNSRIFCERERRTIFERRVLGEWKNGEGEWWETRACEARALHTRGSRLRHFPPSENDCFVVYLLLCYLSFRLHLLCQRGLQLFRERLSYKRAAYATMSTVIMGNKILGFHDWSSRCLKPAEGNSTKPYIHNFSFLLARHHEPQSISPKLLLPIIPIGIVTYAFTLVLDNLCQNSCRKDYTISSEIRSRVSAIDFDIAQWRLSLYDEGSAVFPIARDWVLWRNAG